MRRSATIKRAEPNARPGNITGAISGRGDVVTRTPRLTLRELGHEDEEMLALLLRDPLVMRFSFEGPVSFHQSRQFLRDCMRSYEERGYGPWAIGHSEAQDFLGYCGLLYYGALDGREETELGFRLFPAFWNQGYATEAAGAVLELAFGRVAFTRVVAMIHPENAASIRVVEKLGMWFEKHLTWHGQRALLYALHAPIPHPRTRA